MTTSHGSDDLVGEVVEDRYHLVAKIGRGAMGMVYRARHIRVGREVAIKVLHDHLVRDPVMVKRFEREAAIAARLAHRNVVGVIDVGETRYGQKLMVQELARGESLASIITSELAAGRKLDRTRIIHLVEQLLRGLEHAHAAGLVHRDLKPENVIVEKDDHGGEVPRIVDFGIAVLREGAEAPPDAPELHRLTAAGVVLGTPSYMAPEQAYALEPDPRTDLFALGVMVYEMLAGVHPFDGTSMEIVLANATQDPPAIGERAPGAEPEPLLESFARKLMARKLRDRFQSASEAQGVLAMVGKLVLDREAAAHGLDVRLATTAVHDRLAVPTDRPRPRTRNRGRVRSVALAAPDGHAHAAPPVADHGELALAATAPDHVPAAFARGSNHTFKARRAPASTEHPVSARSRIALFALAALVILAIGVLIGWRLVAHEQAVHARPAPKPVAAT